MINLSLLQCIFKVINDIFPFYLWTISKLFHGSWKILVIHHGKFSLLIFFGLDIHHTCDISDIRSHTVHGVCRRQPTRVMCGRTLELPTCADASTSCQASNKYYSSPSPCVARSKSTHTHGAVTLVNPGMANVVQKTWQLSLFWLNIVTHGVTF